MRTLFSPADRAAIHARLDRLTPNAERRWGRMTAPEMVCHIADQMRVGLGELPAPSKPSFLSNPVLRRAALFWLPWPKGKAPTDPAMLTSKPASWVDDVAAVHALVERVGERGAEGPWSTHPAFGRLSGKDWGRLCYRHLDHHLTQFGV
ncbi:MAG TPA: DUF1569 domain-containing protein [Rubricoccaceae bacterium]|nr:DUF1569 domain-containing protein [Rubricoccaceae bacterium]